MPGQDLQGPDDRVAELVDAMRRDTAPIAKGFADIVPANVKPPFDAFYREANDIRRSIKRIAERALNLAEHLKHNPPADPANITATRAHGEAITNAMLAYRHLEDASMREGKVLQHLDGGVSVYDKTTTVGAPEPEPGTLELGGAVRASGQAGG